MSDNEKFSTNPETPVTKPEEVNNSESSQQPPKKELPFKEKKITGRESFSKARAIIGVCCIVIAIILAIILVPMLSGQKQAYSILYAKTEVPAGTKISAQNMSIYFEEHVTNDASIAQAGIPSAQKDALVNAYTKRVIYQGALVTTSDFSRTNSFSNDRVPEGKMLIALDIPSLSGDVAYMPKAGDIIQIYHMVSRSESDLYYAAANMHVRTGALSYAEPYSYLQYVQVYKAVDANIADSDEKGTIEVSFVLAVRDGKQAQQIVEAAYSGNYYFALVSSGDQARAQAFLNYQDRVIDESETAGRTEYFFNLKDFSIVNEDVPIPNDVVRFSAAVNNNGKTSYTVPDMLKYVDVVDIYDKDGNSIAFAEELDPDLYQNGSIGLLLSEEQATLLQKYIKEAQVFMSTVHEERDSLVYGFEQVDKAIWAQRAKELMTIALLPSTVPSTETSESSDK